MVESRMSLDTSIDLIPNLTALAKFPEAHAMACRSTHLGRIEQQPAHALQLRQAESMGAPAWLFQIARRASQALRTTVDCSIRKTMKPLDQRN